MLLCGDAGDPTMPTAVHRDAMKAAFATYYGNYHAVYEPTLCHLSARTLFDSVK